MHVNHAILRLCMCVAQSLDWLCNLEIGAQSRDSENAQRNVEMAQILRLRRIYILVWNVSVYLHFSSLFEDVSFTKPTKCFKLSYSCCWAWNKKGRYKLEEKISKLACTSRQSLTTDLCLSSSMFQMGWLFVVLLRYICKLVELYIHAHPPVNVALQND